MAAQPKPGVPTIPTNPAMIFNAANGYQNSFVLKAGVDLDIFTAIAKGSHATSEIARAVNASERGIRILCDALTILGFLGKNEASYFLTPESATFLDSRSPAYLGNAFKFLLDPTHLENMVRFGEAVRRGGSASDRHLAPEDPIWLDFARGMAPLIVPAAEAIAKHLKGALAGIPSPKVLDIAAGHGLFGITVAQQITNAQIYAVDWANVLDVAHENAQARGVVSRLRLIKGSAFAVDYGSGYDAVLLTNFLHHFDPAANEMLLKKVLEAMNRGGHLVILEFVPNPDRVSPPIAAMFSVNMLAGTPSGDAYTFAELAEMCAHAGFADARLVPLETMPQSLVLAEKP